MNIERLRKIIQTPGAPGHEHRIREALIEILTDHVSEHYVDRMGNLVFRKPGKGPKVMFAAHMDEISLISTHVDENGFVRFSTLGGFDAETLISQNVTIHGKEDLPGIIGKKPVHIQSDEEKKKKTKLSDLFIDTGLEKDEVKDLIPEGSTITRLNEITELGHYISSKSLDNRISCYILAEALMQNPETTADIFAVFTVQEEVGIRGARVAAQAVQPDIGINLDVTIANDLPGVDKQDYCTRLGEGTAIKVMDKSIICTPSLVRFLEKLAQEHGIKTQREVLTAGGTDTSAMQYLMGIGSHVTSISTPTRYIHSTVETCSKSDVEAGIALTVQCMESIGNYVFE